jgi:hypothetical protein
MDSVEMVLAEVMEDRDRMLEMVGAGRVSKAADSAYEFSLSAMIYGRKLSERGWQRGDVGEVLSGWSLDMPLITPVVGGVVIPLAAGVSAAVVRLDMELGMVGEDLGLW